MPTSSGEKGKLISRKMTAKQKERLILGIDPGTNILGYGVVRVDAAGKPSFVDMGVLDLRKIDSPYDKLEVIHEKVGALCDLHHPDDLAIESPFYAKNAQVPFKLGPGAGRGDDCGPASRGENLRVCPQ